MRKILLPFAVVAFIFFSCKDAGKTESSTLSATAQKNLDACHTVTNAFKTGDVAGIDSAVAADFVDHTDRGDMGRDSLKAMIKEMHAKMGNLKSDIIKELADDEYVFSLQHYSGNSDGSMMPPGPYDMHGLEVIKFKDGKAIEHWSYMQPNEMMKMMAGAKDHGAMDMPKPDSSKMAK
jgi:predicted SnoaL-like aldol condensation-catalyzing enzyme